MKSFSVILAAVAALTPAAMAADCYGGGRQGSDFQYTTVYKSVCNGGVNVQTRNDCQGGCCVINTARFQGTSGRRDKCEVCFLSSPRMTYGRMARRRHRTVLTIGNTTLYNRRP